MERIERWINELTPTLVERERFILGLKGEIKIRGDEAFLQGMVVPSFLVPALSIWEGGPTILCSYGHPEEFDLYKYIAQLNLVSLLDGLRDRGFDIPRDKVVENWYETVTLGESVTQPLNFGDMMPKDKLKADILGISGRKFGSATLDFEKQRELVSRFEGQVPRLAQTFVDRFVQELDDALKEKSPELTRRQRHEVRQDEIKKLISQRLFTITGLVDSALSTLSLRARPSINELLFEVEQRFGGLILGQPGLFTPTLSEVTGIVGTLSSKNTRFTQRVVDTLAVLMDSAGPAVLKRLVASTGDGLFTGVIGDQDLIVSVEKEDDSFILISARNGELEQKFTDDELIDFVRDNNFGPFAKTETLALVAGGSTLHMGSERGNREKVLAALNLDPKFGEFIRYVRKLRIGGDLYQGNEPFLLDGSKGIPGILAFVLFGKELGQMIKARVGIDSLPDNLNESEIKKLAAVGLVESFQARRKETFGFVGSHAGYLWT